MRRGDGGENAREEAELEGKRMVGMSGGDGWTRGGRIRNQGLKMAETKEQRISKRDSFFS